MPNEQPVVGTSAQAGRKGPPPVSSQMPISVPLPSTWLAPWARSSTRFDTGDLPAPASGKVAEEAGQVGAGTCRDGERQAPLELLPVEPAGGEVAPQRPDGRSRS